jgi:hypothetical protein
MPTPTSLPTRYPAAWHALEAADERDWLDQWARLHLIPVTPEPAELERPLATAGSTR